MKQTKYFEAIEQISVSEEKQEEVWKAVLDRTESGNKKKRSIPRWRGAAAAAVIVCVLAVSGTVFADDIKEFFKGILTQNENVKNDVEENVFSDTDGHVTMEVVELLSDEMVINATIKYEAQDETGREWLKEYNGGNQAHLYKTAQDIYELSIEPDSKGNTVENGVSCAVGCDELTEYTTEDEKVFFLFIEAAEPAPAMREAILTYDLTEGSYTVNLDTSTNVPVFEYDLTARNNESVSEYYTPTVLRISKLSYCVYGLNHGLYEDFSNEAAGWFGQRSLLDEAEDEAECFQSISFEMLDGTWTSVDTGWMLGGIARALCDEKKDTLVCSNSLICEAERLYQPAEKDIVLDPAEITGLRIKNVEYNAVMSSQK